MPPLDEFFGGPVTFGAAHPHGSNVLKKLTDALNQPDQARLALIQRIARSYGDWRRAAEAIPFPDGDAGLWVGEQTRLYEAYRTLLDDPTVDIFDSRGALQPSALEEFCTFLFRPLTHGRPGEVATGHHEVFQGLHFTARNFDEFSEIPTPLFPVGNLDFIIGKRISAVISSDIRDVTSSLFIPAVAVECKTYLDRPRWIESEVLSSSIKRGFPSCLYILLSEFIKLDLTKVNVQGSAIDRVYVLRRAQNVDRSIRRADGRGLPSIHVPAVLDMYEAVREHLSIDWSSPEDWQQTGILKS